MPTGRYIDDGAVGSVAITALDGAADFVVVHDDSDAAAPTKRSPWAAWAARMLHTSDISHLTAMAAIASVDLAADELLVFDANTTRFVRMPAEQLIGRVLNRANITGLSNFSALSSIDGASDRLLVWDATAGAFVTLTASLLVNGLNPVTGTAYTSTPTTVTTAMQGIVIHNNGATQVVEFDLPAATGSMAVYTFQRIADYGMRLDPNGSEIVGGGAAGKYLELQSRGRLAVQDIVSGAWEIVTDACQWDMEP